MLLEPDCSSMHDTADSGPPTCSSADGVAAAAEPMGPASLLAGGGGTVAATSAQACACRRKAWSAQVVRSGGTGLARWTLAAPSMISARLFS